MNRSARRFKRPGLSPGTLVHTGERKIDQTLIRMIDYDQENLIEREVKQIEECFKFRDTASVTWINIDGLHDVELIARLGERFKLHPLIQEDIVHTNQRPKVEEYDEHVYIVVKMLQHDKKDNELSVEQFSMIVGPNFVITFQERVGDVFEPIRERLRRGNTRIRNLGPDYLAYALIDAIIDNYFIVLEDLGEILEDLDEEVIDDPTEKTLAAIHQMKKNMVFLRKSIAPVREMLNVLIRDDSSLIEQQTVLYFRDAYDHIIRVNETIESYRDTLASLLDAYRSMVGNRLNEVMKVLTIIATIFIPLTFIAGIYGMNFTNMPELETSWGYPTVLALMAILALGMLYFFRRRHWL